MDEVLDPRVGGGVGQAPAGRRVELLELADRLVAYVAPVLLGARGLPSVGFPGPDTLVDARRWRVSDVTRLDPDVRITMDPADGREFGGET